LPVYRFKDFEAARRALWTGSDARDLSLRIRRLWAFSARLARRRVPRGLRRFRSLEEAARERATWGTYWPGGA
jgi:hypothetical protein